MNLHEIDLRNLYRIWKSGLGPFQGYFRSTPFVSLQTYEDFMLNDKNANVCDQKVLDIIIKNSDENNFIIIDLPFNDILDLALVLNNEYYIKPILNIDLLFHPFGLIGNKENINKLIDNGLKLNKINTNKFVMLIPWDRYNEELEFNNCNDKLNNQYGVAEDDLPCTNLLKELKYSKLIVLTKGDLKEDLNNYVNCINNNISVEIIKVM